MKRIGLVLALSLVACGGDDGSAFLGTYRVTTHTVAEMPGGTVACTTVGPAVTTPAFVELAVDDFFDDPDFIRLSECDAAQGPCVESLTLFRPGDPGLVEESFNSQIGGGFPCQLYYSKATATLSGDVLRIELFEKYDGSDRPPSACTADAAEALASSDRCLRAERYDATRVP